MKIKTLCAHIDCSRNAVMKKEALKDFLPILAKMGYNAVMLYTEDTYEIPEYPFFGYMRGKYTMEDLREIDEYAESFGIELIPCIQVLGHLEQALKWDFLPKENIDVLLCGDEECYKFIDRAFAALSSCIKSRKIHVGLDEAFGIGFGESYRKNGFEPPIGIIKRHMERVKEIADKYGYKMLAWSDMFFRDWNGGAYWIEKKNIPAEVISSVPENVIPVYWDYYSLDYNRYDAMLSNHKQLTDELWFAGGIWGWRGMIPYNTFTINTMRTALDACEKNGCENIMMCMWGDDGNECSRYSHLPSLYFIAKYAHGERDMEKIKAGFEEMFGISFDDYNAIEDPNRPGSDEFGYQDLNPSKYMLYSDYFNGFRDCFVKEEDSAKYAEYAEKLEAVAKRLPKALSLPFISAAKLCRVLVHKYALGLKTRKAYQQGDKEEILRLVKEDYEPLLTLIPEYFEALREQWDAENRPSGFDLQDLRIGGLIQRTRSCTKRLLDYAKGDVPSIAELDEPLLQRDDIFKGKWRSGAYLFTPNVFSGI